MPSYTIAISPEDGSGTQVTVRLEVEDGVARVTEYAVRSPTGAGLVSDVLSLVDLDRLVSAVRSDEGAAATGEGGEDRTRKTRRPAPARSTRTTKRSGQETTRTPSAPAARAYRKLPDDLVEAYNRIGSVTGLAAHYGVPRHTAQGWINRTRKRAAS